MTVVVFKRISADSNRAKTDYGVSGAFSSEDEAKAYIEAHKSDDKNTTYTIATFT